MLANLTNQSSMGEETKALFKKLEGITFSVQGATVEANLELPYPDFDSLLVDMWKVKLEKDKATEARIIKEHAEKLESQPRKGTRSTK